MYPARIFLVLNPLFGKSQALTCWFRLCRSSRRLQNTSPLPAGFVASGEVSPSGKPFPGVTPSVSAWMKIACHHPHPALAASSPLGFLRHGVPGAELPRHTAKSWISTVGTSCQGWEALVTLRCCHRQGYLALHPFPAWYPCQSPPAKGGGSWLASPLSSSLEQLRAKHFSPSPQPNITARLPSLWLPQVLSLGIRVMEQTRLPLGHETGPGASPGDILPPPPRGTRAVGHSRGDLDPALRLSAPCCREGQARSRVCQQPGLAQEAKDESCSGDGRRNLGEAPGRWPGLARSSLDVSSPGTNVRL